MLLIKNEALERRPPVGKLSLGQTRKHFLQKLVYYHCFQYLPTSGNIVPETKCVSHEAKMLSNKFRNVLIGEPMFPSFCLLNGKGTRNTVFPIRRARTMF